MIKINLHKAKQISHSKRREQREKEFAPFDNLISKQIPGSATERAHLERQKIREKYADIQKQIDLSTSPEELKEILNKSL